ncbi:hypothetical protein ACFOKF_18800 [Sphingobium rhizovicinum]|uniref:Uncharacterized protein n=1 Tax=Sphingobium rhizovicinum TaxID=432308 RepID=A0ABV7NIR4_9SPHN
MSVVRSNIRWVMVMVLTPLLSHWLTPRLQVSGHRRETQTFEIPAILRIGVDFAAHGGQVKPVASN